MLVGHSTGGILATRFALLYPERVAKLVLVNPLGLNDTLSEGVPYNRPRQAARRGGEDGRGVDQGLSAPQLLSWGLAVGL